MFNNTREVIRLAKRIESAIQDLAASIRQYAADQQNTNEPSPTAQAERVRNEVEFAPEIVTRYYAEQDKTYRLQRLTFWVGLLTLIALAIYTTVTYETLSEMAKQTKLQRQHAQGVEAARVEPSVAPANSGISVIFDNRGVLAGRDVSFKFKAQRMTLPELRLIEHPIEDEYFEKTVPNTDHGGPVFGKDFSLPGYTSTTFGELQAMQETIKVEGTFSFNDGFDDVISTPVCYYWLTYQRSPTIGGFNQFVDCKGFDITLGNILKEREQLGKEKKP